MLTLKILLFNEKNSGYQNHKIHRINQVNINNHNDYRVKNKRETGWRRHKKNKVKTKLIKTE